MKRGKLLLTVLASAASLMLFTGCAGEDSDVITLRVSNWEEYIDEGDWDEEEMIELSDGTQIIGENSLYEDFEEWYFDTYGKQVKVEYSTFGTNEELYNQLTIGDVFDVVCPSEYMIMKMLNEDMLVPFDDSFYDESLEENYYARGVSPYIRSVYDDFKVKDESLSSYAAGYMWGTLGIVYNPDRVSAEDAEHWDLLLDRNYYRQVTIKDSVRDAYFAAIAIANFDEITKPEFLAAPDYQSRLSKTLNLTDEATVNNVQEILTRAKDNVYSFETDAGKADMVTGKVVANEQWSGDAVYTMDQAAEDGLDLCYSAPTEGTNLWFDGWVMLKNGVGEDAQKRHAAQAFINYLSKPENAIRNMYYIGYTSVISGGDSELIYDYIDYNYGAEEDAEDIVDYDISYFFTGEEGDPDYILTTTEDMTSRQLYAQYPTKDVVDRSVVMDFFDMEENERINRMWTSVRCFDLKSLFGEKTTLPEENGMVYVTSKEDFKEIAKRVKKGDDFAGKKVSLTEDIELDGKLCIGDEEHPFAGIFDGQGHTIAITGSHGVFGALKGTACNLIIDGKIQGDNIAGGVCDRLLLNGQIFNCINKAEVYGDSAGGIAGVSEGVIVNCYNYPAFYDEIEHRKDLDTTAATGITGDDKANEGIENCYVGYGDLFELKGFGSQEMLQHGFLRAAGNLNKRACELMIEQPELSLCGWEYADGNITIGSAVATDDSPAMDESSLNIADIDIADVTSIGQLKIAEPGEYRIADKTLRQILIEDAEGEVKLVLDGVKIDNPTGPAILSLSKKTDVVIELCQGSKNELRGTDYYDIHSKDKKYEGTISVLGNLTIINGAGDKQTAAEEIADAAYTYENSGELIISQAFEGIECEKDIKLLGGSIKIVSLDDAVAAAGDCLVENVRIFIKAGDDGFDCDSTTIENGAIVAVTAPFEHDFNGACYLNGGYVAAGSKVGGKCKKASKQGNLMVKTEEAPAAGEGIALLKDESSRVVMRYRFGADIDRISFSCPGISDRMQIEFVKDASEVVGEDISVFKDDFFEGVFN